jgi:hypothetical protein
VTSPPRQKRQGKLYRDPITGFSYTCFGFGLPAFGAVLAIFWLLITRPKIPLRLLI